jgi:hypothetical protein
MDLTSGLPPLPLARTILKLHRLIDKFRFNDRRLRVVRQRKLQEALRKRKVVGEGVD